MNIKRLTQDHYGLEGNENHQRMIPADIVLFALRTAEAFIADGLEVVIQSPPETDEYIADATAALKAVRDAIKAAEGRG